MSDFKQFSQAVHQRYEMMAKHELFVVDIDGDALYAAYLSAFPPGTNPIFRERTEHDCSCCKNFIRNLGRVVAVIDGELHTVWDIDPSRVSATYAAVARAMSVAVASKNIVDLYRSKERSYGAETSKETRTNEGGTYIHTWNHFHGKVHNKHFSVTPGQVTGEYASSVQVLKRGLEELKPEAFTDVLDLINSNSLYRGAEHLRAMSAFRKLQAEYLATPGVMRDMFIWSKASHPAARFRNTVIGTLLTDLSDGVEMEKAVKSFEQKVAPENYKRPSALITPRMVEDAMKTILELGLEPALERRMARLSDVSVNDVLWVDNAAGAKMKGGLESLLLDAAAKPTFDPKHVEDISIDDFMAKVLPQASAIDLVVRNSQQGNFVTLSAPVHENVEQLFKWKNNFAWSYSGDMADSALRQKVQAAGGRVDGVLRFSHTWNYSKRNASLMDLHVFLPGSTQHRDGVHDNYPHGQRVGWNQRSDARSGGVQDVDYTAAAPAGYVPVENITFPTMDKLAEGTYTFKIHNWRFRAPTEGGFKAEIEFGGQVFEYEHVEPLRDKQWVTVATADLKDGVFTIDHKLPASTNSRQVWGVHTETPTKVATIMKSPNHWDGEKTGNLHWIFVLDGCRNPEGCRGLFNEYLRADLEPHRKVFEVLASKTKCAPSEVQISGVGFSSTRKDKVLVSVDGKRGKKTYLIQF